MVKTGSCKSNNNTFLELTGKYRVVIFNKNLILQEKKLGEWVNNSFYYDLEGLLAGVLQHGILNTESLSEACSLIKEHKTLVSKIPKRLMDAIKNMK